MVLVNYVYAIPLYARFMNYDISKTLGLVHYLAAMVAPFNLIEGVIWAIAFGLIYTLLQPILKNMKNKITTLGEGKLRPSHFCDSWVCDSLLPATINRL